MKLAKVAACPSTARFAGRFCTFLLYTADASTDTLRLVLVARHALRHQPVAGRVEVVEHRLLVRSAAGVVLLPELSKHLRAGRDGDAIQSINRGIELVLLLTLPAAAALVAISHPIISVLFERGAFVASDTQATALALSVFGLGLPGFVLIKVFSPAFFAREDTKTPMRYAGISLTANTIGSLVLFFLCRHLGIMPHLGIAVATTLGGWLNAILLGRALVAHGHFEADARLKRSLPRILLASLMMGVVPVVFATLIGGGFGVKQEVLIEDICAHLTIATGRPVRFEYKNALFAQILDAFQRDVQDSPWSVEWTKDRGNFMITATKRDSGR